MTGVWFIRSRAKEIQYVSFKYPSHNVGDGKARRRLNHKFASVSRWQIQRSPQATSTVRICNDNEQVALGNLVSEDKSTEE